MTEFCKNQSITTNPGLLNNSFPFPHTSRIEISPSAFRRNLRFIQDKVGRTTRISSVVKANAYGHSWEVFVPMAEEAGIRHFSVFSAQEAWQVKRHVRHDSGIMIMGSIPDEALPWVIGEGIEFFVFEPERLKAALESARSLNKPARIHLEFETGMNRTGFDPVDLPEIRSMLDQYRDMWVLEGLCTHYAGAESSSNFLRVKRQIKKFRQIAREVRAAGLKPLRLHTACSAAALTYPETIMDMVRIGIALYGYWPTPETYMHHHLTSANMRKSGGGHNRSGGREKPPSAGTGPALPEPDSSAASETDSRGLEDDPLARVLSWKSHVMSVKEVPPGQFIGYGTSYLAGIPTRVAAVPVGYAYGFSRNLSNLGRVIVGGKRTSVIGVVNMNMMLVDVTETPEVKRGDEVVLIGRQGGQEITVASFSELTQRINYETLVRLPADIPRILVD